MKLYKIVVRELLLDDFHEIVVHTLNLLIYKSRIIGVLREMWINCYER